MEPAANCFLLSSSPLATIRAIECSVSTALTMARTTPMARKAPMAGSPSATPPTSAARSTRPPTWTIRRWPDDGVRAGPASPARLVARRSLSRGWPWLGQGRRSSRWSRRRVSVLTGGARRCDDPSGKPGKGQERTGPRTGARTAPDRPRRSRGRAGAVSVVLLRVRLRSGPVGSLVSDILSVARYTACERYHKRGAWVVTRTFTAGAPYAALQPRQADRQPGRQHPGAGDDGDRRTRRHERERGRAEGRGSPSRGT